MSKIIERLNDGAIIRLSKKELRLLVSAVDHEIPKRRSLTDRMFNRYGHRNGRSTQELERIKELSSVLHEAYLTKGGEI